jgi:hypothetical protein
VFLTRTTRPPDPTPVRTDKLGAVDIERNDSGLGSETGGRATAKVVVVRRRSRDPEDLTCLDCDQILELER